MITQINKSLLSVCLFVAIGVFFVYVTMSNNFFANSDVLRKIKDTKRILYWDAFWDLPDFPFGCGSEIFDHCSHKNCFITKDKNLVPVEEFSAIVFHGMEYIENDRNKPSNRHADQIYIYLNLETPFNTPRHLKFSHGFFNWTISYR